MSITIEEARARVAKGAAHLDSVRPGWFNRIDVGTLTLHDPCGCIVGQLGRGLCLGDYSDAMDALLVPCEMDSALGFDLEPCSMPPALEGDPAHPGREPYYASLQDAWIEAIADRKFLEQCRESAQSADAVAGDPLVNSASPVRA